MEVDREWWRSCEVEVGVNWKTEAGKEKGRDEMLGRWLERRFWDDGAARKAVLDRRPWCWDGDAVDMAAMLERLLGRPCWNDRAARRGPCCWDGRTAKAALERGCWEGGRA